MGIFALAIVIVIALFVMQRLNQDYHHDDPLVQPTVSTYPQATMASGNLDTPDHANDGLTIEFMDSRFYPTNDIVDFDFYIVTLRVQTTNGINIDLSSFTTSEGINLSQTEEQTAALESHQYFLGKANVVYQLVSNESSALFNIFVPCNDPNGLTIVSDAVDDFSITLDPDHNISDINDLFYQANDVISDGKSYQMSVSQTFTLAGDELIQTVGDQTYPYAVPSTISVFTFKLDAVSLFGDTITIESAWYQADDGERFDALGSDITSERYPNIIGQTITDSYSGYLFFEAFSNYNDPVTYSGQLYLKLTGHDEPIVVKVDLNA